MFSNFSVKNSKDDVCTYRIKNSVVSEAELPCEEGGTYHLEPQTKAPPLCQIVLGNFCL